jgi:Fe-S cluster assembly iron-binding protein IscA
MLTITHKAAELLAEHRQAAHAPESYGVRLFAAQPSGGGAAGVGLKFVEKAEPGDQITQQEGITAFVAADVSDALSGATLDASPDSAGEELIIRPPVSSDEVRRTGG